MLSSLDEVLVNASHRSWPRYADGDNAQRCKVGVKIESEKNKKKQKTTSNPFLLCVVLFSF